ncbi:MAG: methyltransferase domain-containing protein [Terriglobia bacterium]
MNILGQRLSARSSASPVSVAPPARASHALAQFFHSLADRTHPSVLDLGPVWHSTVQLLTEAGAKVYTEDPLEVLAAAGQEAESPEAEASAAAQFLEANLRYGEESLDGVLAWDLFEYLPEELLPPTSARLHALLKPGGLLLTVFRNQLQAARGNRYRLGTRESFVVLPTELGLRPLRVLQNRAILDLFATFSSSRTFIRRDNLREVLLVR